MSAKLDEGKPLFDVVFKDFAKALTEVTKVGTFGIQDKGYKPHSWRRIPKAHERYTAALLRHQFQSLQQNPYDDESGLLHAAHTAWNALAVLEKEIEKQEKIKTKQANIQSGAK